jgi:hypothetical protein
MTLTYYLIETQCRGCDGSGIKTDWGETRQCDECKGFNAGYRWAWYTSEHNPDEDWYEGDQLSMRDALLEMQQDAIARGMYEYALLTQRYNEEPSKPRRMKIRNAKLISGLLADRGRRISELEECVAGLSRSLAVAKRRSELPTNLPDLIRTCITPGTVRCFYDHWKQQDKHLVAIETKKALMLRLVKMAKAEGWDHSRWQGVLYIQTPYGQVSFHLAKPGPAWWGDDLPQAAQPVQVLPELADVPEKATSWSGVKNSQEVLCLLFSYPQYADKYDETGGNPPPRIEEAQGEAMGKENKEVD